MCLWTLQLSCLHARKEDGKRWQERAFPDILQGLEPSLSTRRAGKCHLLTGHNFTQNIIGVLLQRRNREWIWGKQEAIPTVVTQTLYWVYAEEDFFCEDFQHNYTFDFNTKSHSLCLEKCKLQCVKASLAPAYISQLLMETLVCMKHLVVETVG